jgi:hypothetical protein
VRRNLQPEF